MAEHMIQTDRQVRAALDRVAYGLAEVAEALRTGQTYLGEIVQSGKSITDGGNIQASDSGQHKLTQAEDDDLQRQMTQKQIAAVQLQNDSEADDVEARRKYADRIYRMAVCWLVFVSAVIVLASIRPSGNRILNLDTSLQLALVGSVSLSVRGFFGSVIGYLFPKQE